jgi:hypothetical protein
VLDCRAHVAHDVERGNAFADTIDDQFHRKRKQLALRGKVVPQRSGRAARFGRDRAHRRSLDPVAARGVDSPRSLLPLIADGVRIVNISSREQRFRSAW